MKKDKPHASKAADLRRRAEERLKERQSSQRSKDGDQRAAEETQRLLQELEIHQIELEMQNEELIQTQNTLTEAMEKYIDLYDFSPVGYFSLTSEALIAEVNLTGSSILGMDRKSLINSHFHQFVAPKHRDHWNNHFRSVLQQGQKQSCDLMLRRKDGSFFYALVDSIRLELKEGTPLVHTALTDITERKQFEEALLEAEDRYHKLVEHSRDMIGLIVEHHLVYLNPAGAELFGAKRPEQILNIPMNDHIHPEDFPLIQERIRRGLENSQENALIEFRIKRVDGSFLEVEGFSSPLFFQGKPAVLFMARDITERKRILDTLRESEQRFRRLSIIDDLTQLNNHRHFFNRLQEEIERTNRYQHQLTMFLLDLDDFKLFNDTYGHLEGDGVLVKVAKIIRECIRQTDSAFRFGGEEFIVLLPETSIDKALILAERIRNEIQQTFFINAPTTQARMTCSIGLSQYQSHQALQAFVKRFDQNMYQTNPREKKQYDFS